MERVSRYAVMRADSDSVTATRTATEMLLAFANRLLAQQLAISYSNGI